MRQVVVEVAWTEGSIPRTELLDFGQAAEDGSHMGRITEFFASLRDNGIHIQRAVISIVQNPLEWLAAYERDHHTEERR